MLLTMHIYASLLATYMHGAKTCAFGRAMQMLFKSMKSFVFNFRINVAN